MQTLVDESLVDHMQTTRAYDRFDELYERYVQNIYGFIARQVWDTQNAEDLTSQTFMKALESIDHYDSTKSAFKTWLFRIARNTVYDFLRTHHNMHDIHQYTQHLMSCSDIEKTVLQREVLSQVQTILKTLSPQAQEIVRLRVWEDLSFSEIAHIMGKTEESVKMSFSRSMRQLKNRMPEFMALSYLLISTV